MEPEEITADWLFEVINQYRKLREMSLVKSSDDLLTCEIAEKKSSKGRLSSTYMIDIKFKVIFSNAHFYKKPKTIEYVLPCRVADISLLNEIPKAHFPSHKKFV